MCTSSGAAFDGFDPETDQLFSHILACDTEDNVPALPFLIENTRLHQHLQMSGYRGLITVGDGGKLAGTAVMVKKTLHDSESALFA